MRLVPAPVATFLMSTWNAGEYVASAIESVLAQTRGDWRMVVVDDCSTDGTPDILARYDDPRIELVRLENNVGQTGALNLGLERVTTPWVARLDQDDVALPTRLERQLAYVNSQPQTLAVGCWADFIDDGDCVVGAFRPPSAPDAVRRALWARSCPIAHSAAFYSTAAALEAGGYRRDLSISQDLALWVELASRGAIANVPETLVRLRHHEGQASGSPAAALRQLGEEMSIHAALRDRFGLEGEERRAWAARRLRLQWARGLAGLRARDWDIAFSSAVSLGHGLATEPSLAFILAGLARARAGRELRARQPGCRVLL
jgi:hypothetical protein